MAAYKKYTKMAVFWHHCTSRRGNGLANLDHTSDLKNTKPNVSFPHLVLFFCEKFVLYL